MSQFIRVLATFFVSLLCLNTLANETVTFYHHDALGSTIAATDANGDTLWTEEYTPYGNRIENKNNAANPFWYTGKQEEMGLNYFQARWYDPKLGRFLSPDPVEFNAANLQSFNRYAYANNNPYMYIDPDGNVAIKLITLGLDFVDFSAAMVAGNYADAGLTLLTMADPTGLGTLARRAAKAKKIADKASVTKGGDKGGLNLFKWGKESTTKPDGWKDGDFMLHLPDKGNAKANWKQNSGHLREQMNKGNPIYDSYRDPKTGQQIQTGGFLNAERKLLESRGWQYDKSTGAYQPPK